MEDYKSVIDKKIEEALLETKRKFNFNQSNGFDNLSAKFEANEHLLLLLKDFKIKHNRKDFNEVKAYLHDSIRRAVKELYS